MTPVEVARGSAPIVLGLPHTGTFLPNDIWQRLNPRGQELADTDWHIHRLYEGLLDDVTTVRATFHRYVIDANRDPSGASLYPGQNTTGLIPLTDFDGNDIWQAAPSPEETVARQAEFHQAYHAALEEELARVRAIHGHVILYDCHSIRSEIPFLFDGTLPDFNIGDNDGVTCSNVITNTVASVCDAATGYSTVINGRFKGGWTTRHYGRPETGVHAIQMELAQSTYMQERAPWTWDESKAQSVRVHLKNILEQLNRLAREGALT